MRGHLGWLAASLPFVTTVVLGSSASAGAQAPPGAGASRPWTVPRTPDGRPDLQGIWTNATLTPLERPRHLGDRRFLINDEVAALEAQAAERQDAADKPEARRQALARGDIGSQ
jgi:hypothetical protein